LASETPVERALGRNHAGLATQSPDRLPRHLLDFGRGAARGIGEPREGWLVRQALGPGAGTGTFMSLSRASLLRERGKRPRRAGSGPWEALKGERSPWKDRAFVVWKRTGNVTDSSAEQSPGVGRSSGGAEVGDGRRRLRSRSRDAIREGRRARVQRRSTPTSVGGDGSPGNGSASLLNGTPGRSGLRSRGTTSTRGEQATSDRSLGARELRVKPESPSRWPASRGEAHETRPRLGRGVAGVTWGSTSVDRSITLMDRAPRSTRRHRT
jgi:hypothetical protein